MERPRNDNGNLAEVAGAFLRLGCTAFGGPAAHIAMMRREFVERRAWLTDEEFADLLGMTNLIPGPNSTEMAIHIGYRRAGWGGLVVAGLLFILPAALIVGVVADVYVRYGTLPSVQAALGGAKPVLLAIVAQALLGLRRTVLKAPTEVVVAFCVAILSVLGLPELPLVFLPALAFGLWTWKDERDRKGGWMLFATAAFVASAFLLSLTLGSDTGRGVPFSLSALGIAFVKVGALLYGSGYVLLSYLETDLVHRLGWLTPRQLLDATAVGQFTPGPVFTTATFVGYLTGGVAGAVVATVAIFLPSFLFVALGTRVLPSLRGSATTSRFLDIVNASSLGLMAAVLVRLGGAALVDAWTVVIGLAALVVLLRTKINPAWIVLAGALVGVAMFRP